MAKFDKKLLLLLLSGLLLCATLSFADDDATDDVTEDGDESEDDNDDDEEAKFDEDNGVLVLTDADFEDAIDAHEYILVEFYAPWCGHCKALVPEFEKAAKELKESDPPVILAKVDSTVHKDVSKQYEVSGYPTLKWFKNGVVNAYDGPRTADGIVAYMKERSDPDYKPPPEAVLTLTTENFKETIEKEPLILVEFYAPWCGHCKQLAPEYEKAAKLLKAYDPPIPLAKVDATVETSLGSEYGVSGYPTIKLFRNGRPTDYSGPRDSNGIFTYMVSNIGDASKPLTGAKDVKKYMNEDDVTIIGFFDSSDDPLYINYKESCNELREEYKCGHSFAEDARKAYKMNAGSVVVFHAERFYTKHEPKWHVLDKSGASIEDISTFIKSHRVPLVGQYTHVSIEKRYEGRPLCLIFYTVDWTFDHRDATNLWRKKFANVAKDYPKLTFAIADEDAMRSQFTDFGLAESGEEINIGCYGEDTKHYKMEPMEEYDADDFREFLDNFVKGNIKPEVKSQPIPKRQDSPVITVVGNSFDDIVMDSTKDVFIEFYAPWCGHCKKLEPIFKKLANKFKDEKNLVIAKIDATSNDTPSQFKLEGFPTIYYAPANKKDEPIKYDGPRDVDGFTKFVHEQATVSLSKAPKVEL